MKFKDYLKMLNDFAEANPESLEYITLYAKDDEGNGYQEVHYDPTLGHSEGGYNAEFSSLESIEENFQDDPEEYSKEDYPINSICIN